MAARLLLDYFMEWRPYVTGLEDDEKAIAGYFVGLGASFGISHIAPLHNFFTANFPRTYPTVNILLPCGRAVFLLLILERGVRIADAKERRRSSGA